MKVLLWLSIIVTALWTAIAADSTNQVVLASAEGVVVVNINDVPADGSSKVGEALPTGAMIVAGDDGKVLLRLADDLFVELQPSSELTIGETVEAGVLDIAGNPLPQTKLTLNSGSLVLLSSEASLAQASVLVVTPRGTVSPVNAGQTLVTANSADPATSEVTVVSLIGEGVVTTTDGSTVPVGEGLAVVLSADNKVKTSTLADLPEAQSYQTTVELASASASNLESTAPQAFSLQTLSEPSPTPTPRPRPSPSPTPTPTPSPSPTPTPRPRPSPSPTPTPSPTVTPSPSPSPTPTPRPRPSPSPTPTPSPTQTPSDPP